MFFLKFFFLSPCQISPKRKSSFSNLILSLNLNLNLLKCFICMLSACYVPKFFLKIYYLANFALFFPYGLWVLLCQLKKLSAKTPNTLSLSELLTPKNGNNQFKCIALKPLLSTTATSPPIHSQKPNPPHNQTSSYAKPNLNSLM